MERKKKGGEREGMKAVKQKNHGAEWKRSYPTSRDKVPHVRNPSRTTSQRHYCSIMPSSSRRYH